jgi:hypothetical protein
MTSTTMMSSLSRRNLVVSVVVLALFVGVFLWSEQIADPRGREFPVLVCGAGIVLCLLDLIAQTETSIGRTMAMVLSGSAHHAASGPDHGLRLQVIAMLWIVAATAVMVLAGFLAGIPLYVLGYSLLHARRNLRQSVIAAIAVTIAIWVGFELLLNYELYPGLLFDN